MYDVYYTTVVDLGKFRTDTWVNIWLEEMSKIRSKTYFVTS